MHEVSVVEGIIDNLRYQRDRHSFEKVKSVTITCGKYNCVDPETLQFCYDAAVKDTWLMGATIIIQRLDEQYRCNRCGREFFLTEGRSTCACGSDAITPRINSDLYISALEAE